MKYLRALSLLAVLLAVASMVAVPLSAESSDASSVVIEDVTVASFTEEMKINAGLSSTFNINVFNKSTSDVSVEMTFTQGDSPMKVTFSKTSMLIATGKSEYVTATVAVDKYAPQDTYIIEIGVRVMNNDGTIAKGSLSETVSVMSALSSGDAFNQILGLFDNPLPSPLNTPVVTAIISLALWIAIAFVGVVIFSMFIRIMLRDFPDERKAIRKKTDKLVFVAIMIYGISNCLRIVGANEALVAWVVDFSAVLYIIIGALIFWGLYKAFISHMFHKMEKDERLDGVDSSLIPLFNMLGKIIIAVTGVASVLAVMGFNLMAILTGAGIAGLAVSLGAQSTLNEFFSGLTLLITRPFKSGDMIRLGSGTEILEVKRVGLMSSEFKNWSNYEFFTMPNSSVVKSTIVNLTGKTRAYRITLSFGVSYDSDLELVKKLIMDAAYEHPQVIVDGSYDKPSVRLMSFDDSCITMRLAVYVNDFEDNGVIGGELRETVFKKFNDNGVNIPFSQMDVKVDIVNWDSKKDDSE